MFIQRLQIARGINGIETVSRWIYPSEYSHLGDPISTLIFGVQFDATLKFVEDAEHPIKNSNVWGLYSNGPDPKVTEIEKRKAKNIYNLAGRLPEITLEKVTAEGTNKGTYIVRDVRGNTSYGTPSSNLGDIDVSERFSINSSYVSWNDWGFRLALYIKK